MRALAMISRIKKWARLARAHTLMASGAVMFLGYFTVKPINLEDAIFLFIVATLVHTAACIHNDVADLEYDIQDKSKQDRPLVDGDINVNHAQAVVWSFILVAYLVSFSHSFEALTVAVISSGFGLYYNYKSKDNVVSEFSFASWESSLVVYGAVIAGGWTTLTYLLIAFIFLQAVYQIQEGSLKDIDGEEKTLAKSLGVYVGLNGYMHYGKKFKILTFGVKSTQVVIIFAMLLESGILWMYPAGSFERLMAIIVIGLSYNLFILSNVYMFTPTFDRSRIIRSFTVHELAGVLLMFSVVYPIHPSGVLKLGVFTVFWVLVVNQLIHTDALTPDI